MLQVSQEKSWYFFPKTSTKSTFLAKKKVQRVVGKGENEKGQMPKNSAVDILERKRNCLLFSMNIRIMCLKLIYPSIIGMWKELKLQDCLYSRRVIRCSMGAELRGVLLSIRLHLHRLFQ